jgi:hypothetical protein
MAWQQTAVTALGGTRTVLLGSWAMFFECTHKLWNPIGSQSYIYPE